MSVHTLLRTAGHGPARRTLPETPVPVRGHPGRLLGAALGFAVVFGLTGLAFLATPVGQRVDGRLGFREFGGYPWQGPLVEPAQALLSFADSPVLLLVLLLSVPVVGALAGRPRAGLAGACALVCPVAGAAVLKSLIPRPELGSAGLTAHNSFPSGHVAGAAGVLFALMLAVPARARWWLVVPGTAAVSAVASATMAVGWHRLSDAIGAVALASAMCCLAAAVLAARPGAVRSGVGRAGGVVGSRAVRDGVGRGGGSGGVVGAACGGVGRGGGLGWVVGSVAGLVVVAVALPVCAMASASSVDAGLLVATVAVGGFTALSAVSTAMVLSAARL